MINMCYYNGIKVSRAEYIRLKDLEVFVAKNRGMINCDLNQGPLYNQPYPVLKANDGSFGIRQMEWGFLPDQHKWPFVRTREDVNKFRRGYLDEKGYHQGYTTLNAMAETLFVNEKGRISMFADAA